MNEQQYEHRMIAFGTDIDAATASALFASGHPVDVLDKLSADGWEVVGVTFTEYHERDPDDPSDLGDRGINGAALVRRPVQQS